MPAIVIFESGGGPDFPAKLTKQVLVCSIIAACGGLMFDYDIAWTTNLLIKNKRHQTYELSCNDCHNEYLTEVHLSEHKQVFRTPPQVTKWHSMLFLLFNFRLI